jgi:hypothetical protein
MSTRFKLWIACKNVDPLETSRLNRFQAFCTQGRALHCEIVIKFNCSQLENGCCPYCNCKSPKHLLNAVCENDNKPTTKKRRGQDHFLTYFIFSKWPYNKVHCKINKEYDHIDNPYYFINIRATNLEIEKARLFLHSQLGKPLNWKGPVFNFLLCFSFGCKGVNPHSASSWFCSELATAALQQMNLLLDLKPCKTSTNELSFLLQHKLKFTVEHSLYTTRKIMIIVKK